MKHICIMLACLVFPLSALAHHSVVGLYVRDSMTEVEGVLTSVSWRNPHVRFSLRADDGQVWRVESAPPTELERFGITRELLETGQRYRVAGDSSRRGDPAVYARNILLPDGREVLTYPNTKPRWSDVTIARGGERAISDKAARAALESANGIFRVWAGTFDFESDVSPSQKALAAREAWVPLRDDPTLRCSPPGMVEAMVSPYPIEVIDDSGDIRIRMEEWNGTRHIRMSATNEVDDIAPSPLGYSAGRWEGDTLVVTTTRISWPYLDGLGTPQSEDVTMTERFAISEDGQRLNWEIAIDDPANLERPATIRHHWDWAPGEEIKPFECVPVEGAGQG